MNFHTAIHIEGAIEGLKMGKNVLDCSPNKALRAYTEAQSKGYKFFIGDSCDARHADGSCAGHSLTETKQL